MENQHVYNQNQLVAEATDAERATFYKHTYGHVAGGVLVFVLIESLMLKSEPLVKFMLSLTQGYLWLALLAGFMGITWVAQKMAYGSVSKSKQYLGYFLYIIAEALIFVPMLYIALNYGGTYVIKQAAVVTGGLFIGLSAIVFLTKADFSVLRGALTIGFFFSNWFSRCRNVIWFRFRFMVFCWNVCIGWWSDFIQHSPIKISIRNTTICCISIIIICIINVIILVHFENLYE